ncbi:hypothetical protein FJTKL_06591 [Diaporthe vaccinii]|uniref:Uncharacterized protein n=1 Tax=Diaporthe vaccinii TaxID=105482 RepID=A0ABR4DQ47_9PEZI
MLVEHQNKTTAGPETEKDMDAVALTCGDFSGHRLYNTASFFAFEFLLDISQRLEQIKSNDSHLLLLKRRIKRVCNGHIIWLLHKAERSQQTSCLRGDYFVTGRAVPLVKGMMNGTQKTLLS